MKRRYGVLGWLRVVETTWGANGWHVHVHALVFLDGAATERTVSGLHAEMFARWSKSLTGQGFSAPLARGQEAHLVLDPADSDIADYFTKGTDPGGRIGLELVYSETKKARKAHGTVPVWHVLDQVEDGDADALDRWHEWERASFRRRQLTWSRGLRELLGLGVERDDESIAAEEVGAREDTLVWLDADGWSALRRSPRLIAQSLTAAEFGGLSAVRRLLDEHGVPYVLDLAGAVASREGG
jgi:hypothetical protein